MKSKIFLTAALMLLSFTAFSQDPNFYIYICFGQSNMEGAGRAQAQDSVVDERFKVLEAVDCPKINREKGKWYTATPPLCRCNTGLSPADYFGRTMVANLPKNIKVGVINVSVAGCKIELFDNDTFESYSATVADWMKNMIKEYGGSPYNRLVEMAKLAQKDGVIKGVLLHQGESNTGDTLWPAKVKKIYDKLMVDLKLDPKATPLLAGEMVNADQNGTCASMNKIIALLPQVIPNSYVISSAGCTTRERLHFTADGYRLFGKRYAAAMLSTMGIKANITE